MSRFEIDLAVSTLLTSVGLEKHCSCCGVLQHECSRGSDPEPLSKKKEYADMRGRTLPVYFDDAAAQERIPILTDEQHENGRTFVKLVYASPALIDRFVSGSLVGRVDSIVCRKEFGYVAGYLI